MTKQLLYKILFSCNLLLSTSCLAGDLPNLLKQKNDYLIFNVPIKLDKLDPILSINAHSKFTLPLIFEPLVAVSAQQELKPVLAKSWKIASDNKTIVITLNKNHHFSDNTEVTAQDVVNSILRLCGKNSQESSQLNGLIGCQKTAIENNTRPQVYAIDKTHVKLQISSSPTTFLYQLSSPSTVIVKKSNSGLVGSGPYFQYKKNTNFIILNKNPFYFGNVTVKNDGIVLFTVEGRDIARMVMQNHPDGALMYRMISLWDFKNTDYKSINTNPNITEIIVLNNQRFPFNIPIVRKALATEIYNNFNYTCIHGAHKAYGIIPNGIGGSIMNTSPFTLPEITAERVFTKVPQLKNKHIPVAIQQLLDTKNDCEAEQIIRAGKKFNIEIKFKYHKDYSDLLPLYMNHHLDAFIDLYIFKNREANNILEFFTQNGENDANLGTNDIDHMLKEAMVSSSSHNRFQVYNKIAQYMQDNNVIIPMFYMDHINLMNKCLSGISNDFIFNPFLELPNISKTKYCKKILN